MAGIEETLTAFDSYYYDAVVMPTTATKTGTELRTETEGIGGGQKVVVTATTDIVIDDTKVVTITLQDSLTEGGSYADVQEVYTVTASGETTIDAGTVIAEFTLGTGIRAWTQVEVVASGGTTGTITAFVAYVPR